jgi:hypothetical protein
MDACRKIYFTTPAGNAARLAAILAMGAAMLASFAVFA